MPVLGSGPQGLTKAQAATLLSTHGANTMAGAQRHSGLRLALRQFESPLVLILIFAAVISLGLRQWVDATIILAIVLGSAVLNFTQEHRALVAVEGLKQRLALTLRSKGRWHKSHRHQGVRHWRTSHRTGTHQQKTPPQS